MIPQYRFSWGPALVISETQAKKLISKTTGCLQVGLHGAPLIFGFLMRPGSALLEIRPHKFEGALLPRRRLRSLVHQPARLDKEFELQDIETSGGAVRSAVMPHAAQHCLWCMECPNLMVSCGARSLVAQSLQPDAVQSGEGGALQFKPVLEFKSSINISLG